MPTSDGSILQESSMALRKVASSNRFAIPLAVMLASGGIHSAIAQSSESIPAPTQQDSLRTVAVNLNHQRGELFRKRDAAGMAAMYTPDASYVELMPRLQVMAGRAAVQKHLEEVMAARGSDLVPTVTTAKMTAEDIIESGGDYTLAADGKRVYGHFFQILRLQNGTWKIQTHVFARPEPITAREVDSFRGN